MTLPEIIQHLNNPHVRSDAYYGGTALEPFMKLVDQLILARAAEGDFAEVLNRAEKAERKIRDLEYEISRLIGGVNTIYHEVRRLLKPNE